MADALGAGNKKKATDNTSTLIAIVAVLGLLALIIFSIILVRGKADPAAPDEMAESSMSDDAMSDGDDDKGSRATEQAKLRAQLGKDSSSEPTIVELPDLVDADSNAEVAENVPASTAVAVELDKTASTAKKTEPQVADVTPSYDGFQAKEPAQTGRPSAGTSPAQTDPTAPGIKGGTLDGEFNRRGYISHSTRFEMERVDAPEGGHYYRSTRPVDAPNAALAQIYSEGDRGVGLIPKGWGYTGGSDGYLYLVPTE